jgi:hypothetical protein
MQKWKRAIGLGLLVVLTSGAALAQAKNLAATLGPESYRVGKGVLFTLHQRLSEGSDDHLVSAFIAACDGSWVSNQVKVEVIDDAGDNLRAQQLRMVTRLQSPINGPTDLFEWSDPDAPLRGLRDRVMKLCKTSRPNPRNLLIPVASTEAAAYSVVSSTVLRAGSLIELWTDLSKYREEPIMFNGKPYIQDGQEVLQTVFTGGKTMRRESINCANRTSAVSTAVYYESGAKDPETVDIPKNKLQFKEQVPNSIGETMVEFVCRVF